MCDLDSFHTLTVDGQMRVLERMLADRRADERARAERYARPLSPLVAAPALPPVDHPLDRAVAGDPLSTATRSGTGDPSPADPAARGSYSEEIA